MEDNIYFKDDIDVSPYHSHPQKGEKMSRAAMTIIEHVVIDKGNGETQKTTVEYEDYRGRNRWTPPMTRKKQYGPWKKDRNDSVKQKKKDKFTHVLATD